MAKYVERPCVCCGGIAIGALSRVDPSKFSVGGGVVKPRCDYCRKACGVEGAGTGLRSGTIYVHRART